MDRQPLDAGIDQDHVEPARPGVLIRPRKHDDDRRVLGLVIHA